MPRTKRNKGKVGGQKFKIQEIRNTLNAPSAPLDTLEGTLPIGSHDSATTSTSEIGTPSVLCLLISYGTLFSQPRYSSPRTPGQTSA